MNYFTSDTHFGHKNIIEYCKRPFFDVEGMTRGLIERWNWLVKPEDTIYHLGDFAFLSPAFAADVLKQLQGYKILVLGNHDRSAKVMRELGFQEVHPGLHLPEGIYLRHEPVQYAEPMPYGAKLHLCGHVHDAWKTKDHPSGSRIVNVGVDQWDYRPITLDQIRAIL